MKKKLFLLFLCLALLQTTFSNLFIGEWKITVEAASKVKLNKKTLYVTKGQTEQLKLSGTKKSVKWSTANKKIATVTSKGKVKGIKKGTVTITAIVDGKKYMCKVIVETPAISKKNITLKIGGTYTLMMKNTKQSIKWSVSDKSVAMVSKNGFVIAIAEGKTTVTAKVGKKNYNCNITVLGETIEIENNDDTKDHDKTSGSEIKNEDETDVIPEPEEDNTKIYATATKTSIIPGETCQASILDENGHTIWSPDTSFSSNVLWTSNNSTIASVTSDGVITGISDGVTTIYGILGNKTCQISISVKRPYLSSTTTVITEKNSSVLSIYEVESIQNIAWITDNATVANVLSTVGNSATIIGVSPGICNVSAIVNGKSYTCGVIVMSDTSGNSQIPLIDTSVTPPTNTGTITTPEITTTVAEENMRHENALSNIRINVKSMRKDTDQKIEEMLRTIPYYGNYESYKEDLSKAEKEVTRLEKAMALMAGDDSEKGQMMFRRFRSDLADAKNELEKLKCSDAMMTQMESLDKQVKDYERNETDKENQLYYSNLARINGK